MSAIAHGSIRAAVERSVAMGASRSRGAATRMSCLALCALLLGGCTAVRRASAPFFPEPPPLPIDQEADRSLDDAEIERRLDFLTRSLDEGETHAAAWQYGWLTVNAGGMAASSVLASLDDDSHDRAYDTIEAVKGLIGTIYLVATPMPGTEGADRIRAMASQTRADRIAQLRAAEDVLARAAVRARQRTEWPLHVGNLLINVAAGAILLGLDEPGLAAQSAGIDTVVGEAQILTQPWDPADQWEEYRRLVATGSASPAVAPVSWQVVPAVGGARFEVKF